METRGKILAECVDDSNRERFMPAGASTAVHPIRAYPELIVRTIVGPGCEKVLENLFTDGGNHTRRYDVIIKNIMWSEIVYILINNDLGTALACIDNTNQVVIDPNPSDFINATGLILLIREKHIPSESEICMH